jgi:hypothetical protein
MQPSTFRSLTYIVQRCEYPVILYSLTAIKTFAVPEFGQFSSIAGLELPLLSKTSSSSQAIP